MRPFAMGYMYLILKRIIAYAALAFGHFVAAKCV